MNNTTKRGYLTIAELQSYANITVTDEAEAYENIEMAEEAIDAYVGFQDKFARSTYLGQVSSVSGTTIFDINDSTHLFMTDGFFTYMVLEVVGGTGAGQMRRIISSDRDNKSVTVGQAFSPQLDTTSVFKIYQLAKFPRVKDVITNREGTAYHKSIPEAVKRATAAQVEYVIQMGDSFFNTDQTDKQSEHIGNYSYSKGGGSGGGPSTLVLQTAPKARTLLAGIINRTGRIISGNSTRL